MAEFDLDEFLPYRISVLASRLSRNLEAKYYALFGISVPEWRIVAHLSQVDSASMREIKERVDLHKSRVSRAARKLEAAGYICRTMNGADRRMVDLSLTAKGLDMMNELLPTISQFQAELNDQLGDDNRAFRSGLSKLLGEQD